MWKNASKQPAFKKEMKNNEELVNRHNVEECSKRIGEEDGLPNGEVWRSEVIEKF